MNWVDTTLGTIAPLSYGKALPESSREKGEIPVYGSNGIVGQHSKAITTASTIVIGRKGSVGKVHFSTKPCWPIDTAFFTEGSQNCDITFLKYLFETLPLDENSDSAIPGLNRDYAHSLKVRIPNLATQKRIATVLGNLDAKVASNLHITELLQSVAQTIFKSWFTDFDPVHAKARGEKPVGMDDETAALFPDSFEESEMGLIPSGWSRKVFGDFVVPKKGKVITKANTNAGSIPVVAGGLEPAYFHSQANVINPVVTISASGANAGFVRLYLEDIWASDCTYISSEQTDYVWFSYAFLKYQQERIFDMQQGGAQPHIYASDLMRLEITLPPSDILINTFDTMVTPFFNQIRNLNEQNRTLTSLRDALLPRLISGELEIPEELL